MEFLSVCGIKKHKCPGCLLQCGNMNKKSHGTGLPGFSWLVIIQYLQRGIGDSHLCRFCCSSVIVTGGLRYITLLSGVDEDRIVCGVSGLIIPGQFIGA